jgi:hypothetical protein
MSIIILIFIENYLFEMWRFKEITKKGKIQKIGGIPRASCFGSIPHSIIIEFPIQ